MALTKGSTGYGSSVKITVSVKGASKVEGSYQNTSRFSFNDKQSGCYGSVTNKEKTSVGDFQWKNGTTGTKNEYKQSSTVRFGDESGYTEVQNEQKVRNLAYDNNSRDSKSYITYNNEEGGPFGGYVKGSEGGAPYGGLFGGNGNDSDDGGPYGGFGDEDGPYGGFGDQDGPYGGFDIEDDGPCGGFGDEDGPYGGFDIEDDGPCGRFDIEDDGPCGGFGDEDGPYGGFGDEDGPYGGFDIEDDGPYGGFDYGIEDDGMYGGYDGYDSDY